MSKQPPAPTEQDGDDTTPEGMKRITIDLPLAVVEALDEEGRKEDRKRGPMARWILVRWAENLTTA